MKIGFIGLGNIGSIMASNVLKAGYDLTVHDLRREAGEQLIASGAKWADSPREVAETCDTIITSLPGPPQVRTVMEDENGVFSGIRSGSTWIEMSTNDSNEVKRLGAIAEEKGAFALDAPLSGGREAAKAGKITIIVGGKKDVYEAHLPLLQAIGGKIFYLGPLGSGEVAKIVTNLLALGQLVFAGEAFMLGKKAGIDLAALFEATKASHGSSYTLELDFPEVLKGTYDDGFAIEMACKDLRLAVSLARQLSVPLKIGGLVEQLFIWAKAQYGPDVKTPQVVKSLEDAMNVYLRAPVKEAGSENDG